MRVYAFLMLLVCLFTPIHAKASSTQKTITTNNCENAKTQSDMDECNDKSLKSADSDMASIYKKILVKYASDKIFITRFKESQKAWIIFRDAEVKAMYPHDENAQAYYGSVYPMCVSNLLEDLTRQRIKQLKQLLTGGKDGDACAGP